ncbi:peptidoglycan editing factor PgeF [Clostridium swellfunianum]|uniref:peptidoglycan editing factor PgeF n=1 Tax=Clostridium swellfunianum TaxID=1367462 RepID=UPI00202DE271|nr:peptidoglycan editing factor PgeF [Clostridium swellfunianum]MCM0648747.1 peptidoglycan editing factor PgeF [Clostridium swellfunianum]
MESLYIDNHEFLKVKEDNANILFSTSKGELDFNINYTEGKDNIEKLKAWFCLKDVGYLSQIHSGNIFTYDGNLYEGDALITDKKNVAVGIFTADCVPVLIFDKAKQVIAAVHSGWKGTLNGISANTVLELINNYGSIPEDLIVYIGPHNRGCCYEIGKDVEELFLDNKLYRDLEIVNQGNLNLERCIVAQLEHVGVQQKNIKCIDICTYCSEDVQLYSYRKDKDSCGRMFSFVYLE